MKLLVFNAIMFVIVSFIDSLLCYFYIFLVVLTKKHKYTGTPLIRSPMGQKRLAVLGVDRIDKVFFFFFLQKNVWSICRIDLTRWPYDGFPL